MTRLREELTTQLASKLDRHHVVVWSDPVGEYREVVEKIVPRDASVAFFSGSWYELRRQIETELSRAEPRLIVYVDRDEPEEDPLAEVRSCGTRFSRQLGTLLRHAMTDELAAAKVDEIAKAASTLLEAEALIESGLRGGPALLVKKLGPQEPTDLVLKFAIDGTRVLETYPDLIDEAREFLASMLGMEAGSASEIAGAIARHLVVVELSGLVGELPASLTRMDRPISADQRRRSEAALHRWAHDARLKKAFDDAMTAADRELGLSGQLAWNDALMNIDTIPVYDELGFDECLRSLQDDRHSHAEELATARLSSRWVIGDETQQSGQCWRVLLAVGQLRRQLAKSAASPAGVAAQLASYGEVDWQIDRAHRRLELALLGLVDRSRVEEVVRDARRAYDEWLDKYLRQFTSQVEKEGVDAGDMLLQGHIHADVVRVKAKHGPVAYFMVDALRFELGQELVDALRRQFDGGDIGIRPALGLIPSITPVGMANLCPGAEQGIELKLDRSEDLIVEIAGKEVMNPPQRVALLQAAHGKVTDFRLDDIVRLTDKELDEEIATSNLVLVRSQEIDEQGETGKLNVGLTGFDATVQLLSRAVARLAHHGITQFVLSADHGFLALTREVGAHMIISKPGGRGEVHRRAFIGRGGQASDALLRVPLSKIGLPGDLDVVVPRGLALIAAGGARGFFHGGLSPQEMIVPVVSVEVQPPKGSTVLVIEADIVSRITSQVFTGKIVLPHSLLSDALTVRPVPVRVADGVDVGVVAAAGDAEAGEGLVRLYPGEEVTLGFRVTSSLRKGDRVELQIFDARTDRRLGVSRKPATVARDLEVDDELP